VTSTLMRRVRTSSPWVVIRNSLFALSRFGERRGWDWLTYHPGLFVFFHVVALRNRQKIGEALLRSFPGTRAIIDVGAGSGAYARWFAKQGLNVAACEHSRLGRTMARLQGISCRPLDLAVDPPTQIDGNFDLAYSFEVAEHVPPLMGTRLVTLLHECAPTVVFTAAHPGQGGTGHINEQPQRYWIGEFERVGMRYQREPTQVLREEFRHADVAPWLVDNVMVFESAGQNSTNLP